MKKITFISFLPALVLAMGLFTSATIVVRAQTATSSTSVSITFPIAELGNCKDKDACKAYCSDSANIIACTNFGETHNLISKDEATRARKFSDVLRGEGPGGCKDEKTCRTYCTDVSHLQACIIFAESHGIASEAELSEMKRIQAALQSGATMPGGCTTKNQCEAYCAGGQHVDECLAFAEKAGTLSPEELAQARKMTAFIKNGETPGGCTSKDSCEQYCAVGDHFNQCIAFAEKAGLISPQDLAIAKKTGGRGPGGCSSKEACDTYCNVTEHTDECFAFAHDHGILSADKIQEIKDGMGRMRAGMLQAPEEVKVCLSQALGPDVISKIQDGTLTPTPQIGESVKACFESQMAKVKDKIEQGLKMAPPEVMKCIEENVGTIDLQKIRAGDAPSPDKGDALRTCFESMAKQGAERMRGAFANFPPGTESCLAEKLGGETLGKLKSGTAQLTPEMSSIAQECVKGSMGGIETRLQQMPPQLQTCIRAKLGGTSTLTEPPSNLPSIIEGCTKEFQPAGPRQMMPKLPEGAERTIQQPLEGMGISGQGTTGSGRMPQFPPQAESCLKSAYGSEVYDKMKSGEVPVPADIGTTISKCMSQLMGPQSAPGVTPGMMPPAGQLPIIPPSGY